MEFMLDIERSWYGPDGTRNRRQALGQLTDLRSRLEQQLRMPSDPKTFGELRAALQSVNAALSVIARFVV